MFSPDTQRCSMMTLRNALKFPALKLQDLKRSLQVIKTSDKVTTTCSQELTLKNCGLKFNSTKAIWSPPPGH